MSKSQFRKSLLTGLFVLICLPIAGWAQSTEQGKEPGKLQNVNFQDASLKSSLKSLGVTLLNLNIVFDDLVKDNKLNIELKDVTPEAAMKIIFIQQRLQARLIEDKTIIIFPDNETILPRYKQYKVWPAEADKKQ